MTKVKSGTNVAVFDPPVIPPFPHGLYEAVSWVEDGGPARFLYEDGVVIRPQNFLGVDLLKTYTPSWCVDPSDGALRADQLPDITALDPFLHETVTGSGKTQCGDLTEESRQEALDRLLKRFLRTEQLFAETQLAAKMLATLDVLSGGRLVVGVGPAGDAEGAHGMSSTTARDL